jgi:serine phosphatase RsbU (regulator of sigma subunit)
VDRKLTIIEVVKYAFARPAGGRRRVAGPLCIAIGTLAVACAPAAAQLPKVDVRLPVEDGAVGDIIPGDVVEETVGGVVNEELPAPVQQVVKETPVAPIRDEVRRIVNDTTDTAGGSGGSTGGGTAGGTGTGTRGNRGSEAPQQGDRRRDGAGNRRTRTRPGRGGEATPGRGAASADRAAPAAPRDARDGARRSGSEAGREERRSAAVRTIETIVKAVPVPIWIALGIVSLLAVALAARTFVERRRAKALERDREQLLHEVELLERALLPAVPERIGALSASAAYRPCDGPAAGGDFYDAFELPDGRAAVVVGDVSGHGAEALEGTNSARAQLHALLEAGLCPRAAIATVGECAPAQFAGRFTTVVVAVHDPAAGTLTYATAGHHPPIIAGPGAEELLSTGASPPIGVGLRTGLRETTVALPSGSVACFYTDGLVEAKQGDGMLGRARLAEMVDALGPDEQALSLLERVVDAADDAPDDMAVCLIRPVSGAQALLPRVELLELDAEDLDGGFAERFLEACGVPAGELDLAREQARAAVATHGRALLEVTVSDGLGRARVDAADQAAPHTPV